MTIDIDASENPVTTKDDTMRIASVGHLVFAVSLVAIGITSLVLIPGGIVVAWGGLPKTMPAREVIACVCAVVFLACGAGLLWRRSAAPAARVLLASLLLWMVLVKGRYILFAPLVEGSWQSCGETAVLVAAAWVLYACFATDRDRRWLGFATGGRGLRIARVIYALAMLAFGLSHFFYLDLTAPLIPRWLPWHVAWAYFFGCTYIAAGIGMLIGVYARLAAVLSAVQMGLFTVLVWVPLMVAGNAGGGQWSEFVTSWAITIAAWVVADSYRGAPWLSVGNGGSGSARDRHGSVSAK